jgi:hypothetical protein
MPFPNEIRPEDLLTMKQACAKLSISPHRPFPLTCGEKGPVPSRIRSVQVWDGTKIFRPTLTTSIRRFSSWDWRQDQGGPGGTLNSLK